jgi:hypothetical protein
VDTRELVKEIRDYTGRYDMPFERYLILTEAADRLEYLTEENKQLRNDLTMQTALAQNGQSAMETNKQLTRKFEALLEDFKEFILNPDDTCTYCENNQPCLGKECEFYIEGNEAWDHKGCKHDWEWSCKDFNFGECPMLENTPCNRCFENDMSSFEWRGVKYE